MHDTPPIGSHAADTEAHRELKAVNFCTLATVFSLKWEKFDNYVLIEVIRPCLGFETWLIAVFCCMNGSKGGFGLGVRILITLLQFI